MMYDTELKTQLAELGFIHIGSQWYRNESDTIRIRLWTEIEIDFWEWAVSEDYRSKLFSGKIYSIDDVKWVLSHCFDMKFIDVNLC